MQGDPYSKSTETEHISETLHRQIFDSLSHDLRTPLSTIIGSLEVHERKNARLTQEKKDILIRTALSEAYRLDSFITNILDMAKLEGNRVKVRPETCDIEQMISDCLLRLGPKRNACAIQVTHPPSAVKVISDYVLLSRALCLILDNAIKHNGNNPAIAVEYGIRGDQWFIKISDNGRGIPAGKEKEIFKKYVRFTNADRQNAGTGLGLAICAHIIKLLSGEITAENRPEGGATFTIVLPYENIPAKEKGT